MSTRDAIARRTTQFECTNSWHITLLSKHVVSFKTYSIPSYVLILRTYSNALFALPHQIHPLVDFSLPSAHDCFYFLLLALSSNNECNVRHQTLMMLPLALSMHLDMLLLLTFILILRLIAINWSFHTLLYCYNTQWSNNFCFHIVMFHYRIYVYTGIYMCTRF